MNFARYLKLLASKETQGPVYLILFVTRRCVAACKHCFVERDERARPEITLEQAGRLAESLGGTEFMILTGGEPFLRQDLADLAAVFHEKAGVNLIGIPTNGYLTEEVLGGVRAILDRCPGLSLGMDVSIDGIGADHDEIRGLPGLYERAVSTLDGLQRMRGRYPGRLNVAVAVTVSSLNQAKLPGLYRHLKDRLGVENITCLLARGKTKDPAAREVPVEAYRGFVEMLEHEAASGRLGGYDHFAGGAVVDAMKGLRARRIVALMKGEAPFRPCFAAELACAVTPEGLVMPCELRPETMGDLAEAGWDMRRIWAGPERREISRRIRRERCQCTHECFLTNGILFSPRSLPALALGSARLAVAKRGPRRKAARSGP